MTLITLIPTGLIVLLLKLFRFLTITPTSQILQFAENATPHTSHSSVKKAHGI